MSDHPNSAHAQIVKKKGSFLIKIVNNDKSVVWARRERHSRQILYDRPERVPRIMKNEIVPELFKKIDAMKFS
jgi:hypothetical protein